MAFFEDDEVIEICSSDSESLEPDEPQREDGLRLLREFMAVCKPLLKSNQQKSIAKLLTDKFNEAKESYTQSEDFRCFMREHISDLQLKRRSVYVHIQDVKAALMRASNSKRVQLTTLEVEKAEDAKPAAKEEVAEKASQEDEDVSKNGRAYAKIDTKLAAQEKVEQRVDRQENEDIVENVRADKMDAKPALKEDKRADPQVDEDVTKNGSADEMEVNPVVTEEVQERVYQQDNKDIAKNGRDDEAVVKPANRDDDVEREDPQAVEDDARKGRADGPEVGIAQETYAQSEDLLMTCETVTSDHAADDNALKEEKSFKESKSAGLDAIARPSTNSLRDDSIKMLEVGASSSEVPEAKHSDRKSKGKDKGKGSQKQIRKLEKVLNNLDKAIKKLQERELTLDEMDESDSTHIQEYQLRRRFVKVYTMLCELNGCSSTTGRVIEQRVRYEGTRFPEINRRLEKLVNKKDFFPDFPDIHKAVLRTNKKKDLGLDMRKVRSIAREAFEDLGGKLQKRRQQDFILNFSAHSTLDFINARDSADKDPELKQKLIENRTLAKQNLRQVEDSFVKKQEECEKKGESLEASEHSDSDAPPDQPSEDEEEEAEPASKKPRLDPDKHLSSNEENSGKESADEDSTDHRQFFETDNQEMMDIQATDLSTFDKISAPKTNTLTRNPHPKNVRVCTFSNGHFNANNSSSKIAQTVSASTWNERNLLSFDTPEQAVKSLKFDQPALPSPSLPLVITNVCSLSEHSGFFPGPDNKDWDEDKATIARVVDDGKGGILISPPSQQRIMVVKSGKSVKLQTSTPITLSFEDAETKPSTQRPSRGMSVPTPSPPPSVTSTRPELDASPEVEEVVDERDDTPVLQTEKRLEVATTSLAHNRRVTSAQCQNSTHTARVNQSVVSDTSRQSRSGFVRCNHCMQTWKETEWCKHFCAQSRRVSHNNVQSYPPKPKVRTSLFVYKPDKSISAPNPQAMMNSSGPFRNMNTPSKPQSAQDKVFNLYSNFPKGKTSPKWQPSPRRLNLPSRLELQDRARPRQPTYTKPVPSTNANNEDSEVVVISDSEVETSEESGNRAESFDVICISDSD
ncbi:uncharacterized protein LOC119720551 [Patiria miniata]|uniref:Daxx histone-binding domain-containing protein n=1 Tax=Patiria miniata TaxID=46514 RepID=A0A913Z2X8_PATMI|nr:uncharacterized protein LOC119720551 [Patiria miniata]